MPAGCGLRCPAGFKNRSRATGGERRKDFRFKCRHRDRGNFTPIVHPLGRLSLRLTKRLIRNIFIETAKSNKIKYQLDIIDGGMTDGAIIYMNKEGVPTGVLSIPTRYIHSPTGVFSLADLNSVVALAVKVVERVAKKGI